VVEDPGNPNLLFAGTEYGLFFTSDGGKLWTQLKGGLPPIAVRDLAIQARENDLVLGTFGRGFYVLDDYSPLRAVTPEALERETILFPSSALGCTWRSCPSVSAGNRSRGLVLRGGESALGAVVTYYLKTKSGRRRKRAGGGETDRGEGGTLRYPSWTSFGPRIGRTLRDSDHREGREREVVRRLEGPVTAGFHRVAWDFRFPDSRPTRLKEVPPDNPFVDPPRGPMVVPDL